MANFLNMGNGIMPVGMPASSSISGLDSALGNASQKRKHGIMEPSASALFDMSDRRFNKKSKIESHTGQTMPPANGPLDGFRTNLIMRPYLHTPMTYPQRAVNQSIPFTRIAKRGISASITRGGEKFPVPVLDTVAKHQWGIMSCPKSDTKSSVATMTREILNLEQADGMNIDVDMTPVTMLSPAVWNYYMYIVQMRIAEKSPEAARLMTASDIIRDWQFDGVCIAEEMLNGAESARSSGFPSGRWMGGDGYKVLTMNLKNECHCYNVFGDSVMAGSALYAVVKKMGPTRNGYEFNVAAKNNADAMTPYMRYNFADPVTHVLGTQTAGGSSFYPFQMYMVSVPDDGPLPTCYVEYVDELGVTRYDSEVIYLGKTLIEPQGHEPRPLPRQGRDMPAPSRDARQGASQPLMKVLVKARGHFPL